MNFTLTFLTITLYLQAQWANCCTPNFPLKDGWLGGDAIYSVPISKIKSVWFFGDSFVGKNNLTDRNKSNFIANSVAVSTCNNNLWNIKYYWKKNNFPGTDSAMFNPKIRKQEREYKYWPKDGFFHNNKLYVLFDRIGYRPELGIMGFESIGTVMITIENPDQYPTKWIYSIKTFTEGKEISPGISIVKKSKYVYFFTNLTDDENYPSHKNRPVILLRLALNNLHSPSNNLQILTNSDNNKWITGSDWKSGKIIMEKGTTEMSVRFHPDKNLYVAVMNQPDFFTKNIISKSSRKISGPWINDQNIYSFNEMNENYENYSENVFCYASKEHIQFKKFFPGKSVISYACNSLASNDIMNNNDLYRPIIKIIDIP